MKMTFRWYGSQMDPIPLRYIKQIPNMSGVVSSLMDLPAGALWPTERIQALKQEVQDAGLELEVIESVNVHEDIKLGLPGRDAYIDRYRTTIERLGQAGVKVICYNFMPVFDWTRSDLFKHRADGATVLAYDQAVIDKITDPQAFADQIQQGAGAFEMAGWEPERVRQPEHHVAVLLHGLPEPLVRQRASPPLRLAWKGPSARDIPQGPVISHEAENFLKKSRGAQDGSPGRYSGKRAYFFACHLETQREQAMSPVTFRQVRPMSKSRSTATMRPM